MSNTKTRKRSSDLLFSCDSVRLPPACAQVMVDNKDREQLIELGKAPISPWFACEHVASL